MTQGGSCVNTLVLSGGGDFTDPWHPFSETSARVAELMGDLGHDVTVSDRVIGSLVALKASATQLEAPDLVIINAGNAEKPTDGDAAAIASLERYLERGGALIVMHVAATAFPETDGWERIVGGRWVRGTTMHPDEGDSSVRVIPGHPITDGGAGVRSFEVFDEMYSWLRVCEDMRVLATHEYEGIEHPLVWAHEVDDARVVYDALGHTPRSFAAMDHARLLQNAARWVLRDI